MSINGFLSGYLESIMAGRNSQALQNAAAMQCAASSMNQSNLQQQAMYNAAYNSYAAGRQAQQLNEPISWYRIGDCYVFEYSSGRSETRCVFCFQEWRAGHNCISNIPTLPAVENEVKVSPQVKTLVMDGMIQCEMEYQDEVIKKEFIRLEELASHMEGTRYP